MMFVRLGVLHAVWTYQHFQPTMVLLGGNPTVSTGRSVLFVIKTE